MLPSIETGRARLSKSAPNHQLKRRLVEKKELPMLNKPKAHLKSAPPLGRLKKTPSGIKLSGKSAPMSPKVKKTVIAVTKTNTYNYTILPGNNTRVVMNSLRLRPWWRCNPKIIPTNHFIWEMFRNRNRYKTKKYRRIMLNHIQNNHVLVTKSGLYLSLKSYCSTAGIELSTIVPQTFYLSSLPNNDDRNAELENFISMNNAVDDHIIWILKPAFASNQGCGIKVVSGLDECLSVVGCQSHSLRKEEGNGNSDDFEGEDDFQEEMYDEEIFSTNKKKAPRITEWIVQRYMTEPLLVRGRKFDIRCFVLLVMKQTSASKVKLHDAKDNFSFKAYLYRDGYIRTSGKKYNLNNLKDKETHLTNDSVQKKASSYGKFESGNKLSYDQFQDSINQDYPSAPIGVVRSKILPQIEYQVKVSLRATMEKLTQTFINKSFELLGYDFMVDTNFDSTLIEINSNPSLELSGLILEDLIPHMVENTFQLAVDALVPPPPAASRSQRTQDSIEYIQAQENRYTDLML